MGTITTVNILISPPCTSPPCTVDVCTPSSCTAGESVDNPSYDSSCVSIIQKYSCPFKDVVVTKVGDIYEVTGKTKPMMGFNGGGINSVMVDFVKGSSALLAAPTLKVGEADYTVQDSSADINGCTDAENCAAGSGNGCGFSKSPCIPPASLVGGNSSCGENCSCWANLEKLFANASNATNATLNVSGRPASCKAMDMTLIIGIAVAAAVVVAVVVALVYFKPGCKKPPTETAQQVQK